MKDKGKIIVKGLCYEDLVSILTTNGYEVRVKAYPCDNSTKNTYEIKYKRHKENDFLIGA